MDKLGYSILFFAFHIIGLAYIAWRARLRGAGKGFIIGNRTMGFWGLYGSVISYMRAGSNLVFWFSFVALMGFGSIWILIAFYTGFILMTLLAPLAQRLSHQNNYITFADLIEDRQGSLMAIWLNIFSFYVILIMVVAQLFVMGNVVGDTLNIGNVPGIILGSIIVAACVSTGGFLSVVRTDIYQAFIIVLFAVGALLFCAWPPVAEFKSQLFSPNIDMVVGFGLIGFAVPASTDMWQRYFAARTPQMIVPATFAALFTDVVIILGIILFIQNILAATHGVDPAHIFGGIFNNSSIHPAIIALFGVFVVSTLMPTLGNQIFNSTSIITKNILRIDILKERRKFIWMLRLVSSVLLILFTTLSLTIKDFMQWVIDTYAFVGVITPFIFYGVLQRAYSDKLLATGVLASSLCYWVLYVAGFYTSMYWYIVPYSAPLIFILWDYALSKTTSEIVSNPAN